VLADADVAGSAAILVLPAQEDLMIAMHVDRLSRAGS
jgi:hypothetical protein